MSGGSWEYSYHKINEVADMLQEDGDILRRAFGNHMKLIAVAMHDIEWSDSGDIGKDDWRTPVEVVMNDLSSTRIELLKVDARKLIDELKGLIE